MITIGSVKIDTNIFLAPLSGCSDLAFRLIAREHGAKFCFFEMVDANALTRNHKQTIGGILKTIEKDSPIAGQLLGADPALMLDAAQKFVSTVNISFLDINSACPVKKVVKKGAGAYLLETPEVLHKIVKKLSSSLNIPITVKIRTGYHKRYLEDIVDIARKCEENGAQAVFVHGRTQAQGYEGPVDYESIRSIKQSLNVPVLGSGNIFTPELAKKMLDETGCDGILIARGVFGKPWIFKDTEDYLKNGKIAPEPGLPDKKKILKKHLTYIDKYRDSKTASKVGFMRKIAIWYLKGFPHAAKTRNQISRVQSYSDLLKLIDNLPICCY